MAATDERAIHEFPTGTIDDNSLLIMDRPTLTPGEYETEKFAIANLGLKLLGGIDFPNNLDTDEQDIFGAINEVNSKAMNIAEEYDETGSYSKGDYCIYQNAAYRCIKASGSTTGTFVAADWTLIKVLSEVKTVVGAINELNTNLATTNQKIDYLRSHFYLGNYTQFTITLPDIRDGGNNFNHMTMVIGNNALAILCCSYGQNTVSVVSLGSNTITATKQANSFNITVNLADTSWGGIRVITLD
ncbi:MAG: hypothetical protein J6U23_13320 [Clostridiales bacterium]|nr:hypothetical protein [Clostridiales bacterium]